MQVTTCILFLLSLLPFTTQEKDEWQRLYTFEDSTVDVSTSNIWFGTDFTGRIRFLLTLSKPEPVPGETGIKYKSVIETIEFRCSENLYRVVNVKRLDSKGNIIDPNEEQPTPVWKSVKAGSMMDKFYTPGCEVIYKKKRNP
jgi:Surface-adhesin protein E